MVTTIQLNEDVKKKLDALKVHHRETYNELLERIISSFSDADKESLIETINIISNPETMRNIAEGLEEFERGETKTLEEVSKELEI